MIPPRLVIVAVVTLIVFAVTLPVKVRLFKPLRLVMFALTELIVFAVTLFDTVKFVKVPT